MAGSIVLVTWRNKDHPQGIHRQIAIPPEIDPRTLGDSDIWEICYSKGIGIYGDLSWEILINNSVTCHQTETQIRAGKLYEKLADILIACPSAMEILNELYEIAHDNGDHR